MPLPNFDGFNLYKFRETVGDPGRPYLFLVNVPQIGTDTVVTAMARSTNLPGYTVGQVAIPFQGVNIKIGTTPEYQDWTVNFLCDEAHELRRLFMNWQAIVYDVGLGLTGHSNQYKSDQVGVAQLARTGAIIAAYNMVGAWPKSVGDITIGHDQNSSIEQFDVTFAYDYYILDSKFGESTNAAAMIRGSAPQINRGNSINGSSNNFTPQ